MMLYREVGNTASCIDSMRLGDRIRRTSVNTTRTFATMITKWFVRWQIERCDQLCQKKPCPQPTMNLHSGFTTPSQTSIIGKIPLQHRSSVTVVSLSPPQFLHRQIHLLELVLNDMMVVLIPGITGDTVVHVGMIFGRQIIKS